MRGKCRQCATVSGDFAKAEANADVTVAGIEGVMEAGRGEGQAEDNERKTKKSGSRAWSARCDVQNVSHSK